MDFAALMANAIAVAKAPTVTEDQPKKFVKRSELEAERREKYLADQRAIESEKAARTLQKRRQEDLEAEAKSKRELKRRKLAQESRRQREEREAEEERATRKRLGLPEHENEKVEETTTDDITDEELFKGLRAIGQPAKLFGESHKQRLRRLSKLGTIVSTSIIPTTLELLGEKDMKVESVPKDSDGRRFLFRQLASYFTMVMTEWESALNNEKRDTFASKAAHTAMLQSKESMTPLFRKFEKADLDDGILEPIVEIVKAAQERRYVDANDGYLRLSIGKAAWPIGVTMVGIHERSAREKLHENDKGHVMGDEITRKFLQSIKRCLSFAQVRWPPDDIRQLMG
ncbi:BgTH12-03708 [Blumeria graminis f. sp. triticale]|uniref:Pre-mRNA-splicing factor 18 n=3 Tax=Blumeria graminis TaxID=34373 RepID=A0A061HQM3_BLUGR|nr:Splicing factor [Blumeria graminis f. sp. tritici 96224]CAD6499597.1 BgTH12-03708 [Blumeria graminis f. sp. triticale]VCU39785.1 Bgt-2539 [Blumeria graminis f. sp. tritici]